MDKKIEKAISKLLSMYEKIENDLLIEIASHFSIEEEFQNSDHWRIKKLEEMGLFNQDIVDYLKRETKGTDEEIKQALNQIGIDTVNLDRLNRLFEDEVLKIDPNILANNYTIKNIINTAYNEVSECFIQMSNKIEKGVRTAYLNVVEEGYLKTSMGTHSYQEAIREAINDLSNNGIKILTYKTTDENGNVIGIRNYDIESAVRREVLTASRQLNNAIALEVANELECEYLYLSEHLQCRPNHFDWQGTIIKREDLIKVTNYGKIDGLAGINCRHYFEPYFGDGRGNDLKQFNEEECTDAYNLSQKQRYLERGIRKWKRKGEMYKASDDVEAYSKCKDKVKEWQSKIDNFTKENDLRRDFSREYVTIRNEKQFFENEKVLYKDVTQEWLDNTTPNSHEMVFDDYFIDDDGIKHPIAGREVAQPIPRDGDEVDRANWLKKVFGGEIHLVPRITDISNQKESTHTPDFRWKGKKWDLKTPTTKGEFKNSIERFVKKKDAKLQAKKFIINFADYKDVPNEEIIKLAEITFKNPYRAWIEDLMLVKGEEIIKIYSKK